MYNFHFHYLVNSCYSYYILQHITCYAQKIQLQLKYSKLFIFLKTTL